MIEIRIAVSVLLLFAFMGCGGSRAPEPEKSQQDAPVPMYRTLAEKKLGKGAAFFFNADKSRVICLIKKSDASSRRSASSIRFFVYDLGKKRVVFEDAQANASVSWVGPDRIRVAITPGIVKVDREGESGFYGYDYDLELGRKVPVGARDRGQ